MYDCLELIFAYLNEWDKVRECRSCLKMIIQAYLHVRLHVHTSPFTSNVHHLSDSICIWNCCNHAQFLSKKQPWSVLLLKFLPEIFLTPSSKNIIGTQRIVTIEMSELIFLLILYFHGKSFIFFYSQNCIPRCNFCL